MDIYDSLAVQYTITSDDIQSYSDLLEDAVWIASEKVALATLFAVHDVNKGELEGFIGAYGKLPYTQIIEQEQQPGQGVSRINRDIFQLITTNYQQLQLIYRQTRVMNQ